MAEPEKEGFFTDHEKEEGGYVPLRPRAYHINQAAIDVCNTLEMAPVEAILELNQRYCDMVAILEERDKMISSLKNIVPTDGRPVYTLQEFGDVMRKVCQTEGVMLHEKQKGFFRDLFSGIMQVIRPGGE